MPLFRNFVWVLICTAGLCVHGANNRLEQACPGYLVQASLEEVPGGREVVARLIMLDQYKPFLAAARGAALRTVGWLRYPPVEPLDFMKNGKPLSDLLKVATYDVFRRAANLELSARYSNDFGKRIFNQNEVFLILNPPQTVQLDLLNFLDLKKYREGMPIIVFASDKDPLFRDKETGKALFDRADRVLFSYAGEQFPFSYSGMPLGLQFSPVGDTFRIHVAVNFERKEMLARFLPHIIRRVVDETLVQNIIVTVHPDYTFIGEGVGQQSLEEAISANQRAGNVADLLEPLATQLISGNGMRYHDSPTLSITGGSHSPRRDAIVGFDFTAKNERFTSVGVEFEVPAVPVIK